MGLLDDIKPQAPRVRPREITIRDRNVVISWDDDRTTSIDMRLLRLRCPCAGCVEEWSGRPLLDPATVPESVRPLGMHEVGRYAIQIDWSDGHDTGIYTWELLRKLGEENPGEEPG